MSWPAVSVKLHSVYHPCVAAVAVTYSLAGYELSHWEPVFGPKQLREDIAINHHALDQSGLRSVKVELPRTVECPRSVSKAVLKQFLGHSVEVTVCRLSLRD
jgi:hypothetical protein